eukprot:CAMPEP_0169434020 /NCGR_PEP_ID=MMETSP1042-20121227/4306_1 /TAXON_ID=464988 /ORGANISM="Hemiselmis andersenii, Strain CCMP1180" /LENGTH=140 /DNA_ID=CAMNT_0009544567 /DNA_START=70 /DNA_END=493 /DNA_ORIENTATION=-
MASGRHPSTARPPPKLLLQLHLALAPQLEKGPYPDCFELLECLAPYPREGADTLAVKERVDTFPPKEKLSVGLALDVAMRASSLLTEQPTEASHPVDCLILVLTALITSSGVPRPVTSAKASSHDTPSTWGVPAPSTCLP